MSEAFAIVGLGCALPGALDPEALWALVRDGRVALRSADPTDDWGVALGAAGDPAEIVSRVGGEVTGFDDGFEPRGFRVPEDAVRGLDLGSKWALHAARQALGSADPARAGVIFGHLGYPSRELADAAVATWLGAPTIRTRGRFAAGGPVGALVEGLGLGGPAFALDAACASSLVAIASACDRLADGTADVMLAGGLNTADDLCLHAGFTALGALSPSGRSRPFHRDADGLIPARGAAFVALMRLADAEASGRPVLGVIRGYGLSNDGRSVGVLTPAVEGQVRAIRSAWAMAGLDPAEATLLECHATGTRAGDAIEVASLAAVFGGAADLPIGSLKSNLGHLITAAGVAGLIKVLFAMREGVRPATLHVDAPIELPAPLRLLRANEPWTGRRLAGLSAFGFGGNNAHVVVEAPGAHVATAPRPSLTEDVVVVAFATLAGDVTDASPGGERLLAAALDGAGTGRRIGEVGLDVGGLGVTPTDLDAALPQQAVFLAASLALRDRLAATPRERTGIYVGIQVDPEAARYAARWRAAAIDADVAGTRRLVAADVLGCMPNLVANRLSRAFDVGGPGYTVSAEEASGHVAFDEAVRAIRRGQIDVAIVGAVDLCDEPVHAAAVAAAGGLPGGDAAVVVVLARRGVTDGALARVTARPRDLRLDTRFDAADLAERFGLAQAATGLLGVAVGAAACAAGRSRGATITATPRWGGTWTVGLASEPTPPSAPPPGPPRRAVGVAAGGHWAPVRAAWGPPGAEVAPGVPLAWEAAPPTVGTPADARASLAVAHAAIAEVHRDWLRRQADGHAATMALLRASLGGLTRPAAPGAVAVPNPPAAPIAATPAGGPRGRTFSRADLEHLASGRISERFGPVFLAQDRYARQVRMPEPPLLLADRVTGLVGEPGTMGKGTIWTETDVRPDAWYLFEGRMPAGLLVESGQADLLLISWLGADLVNRGERVYRLLGCDLVCHGALPTIGDTLRYEIHVDGHAAQGDVRLFFFHYDCHVGDTLRLSVRNGQAGFFTDEELAGSAGILWDPATARPTDGAPVDPPAVRPTARVLDADAVGALIDGDLDAFGPGYGRAHTHTRSPTIQGGRMRLLDDVTHLDPTGGPWGRGYLRARLALTPESWFFAGHFKNDPCMPGTLMFEGCLQAMAIYLASLGVTLPRDGWRFEPVPEVKYELRCRAQAIPSSREVTYEVFVDAFVAGPVPTLYADILGRVDGRKAFWCRRMGLRLVPGWPLEAGRVALPVDADGPATVEAGFRFDPASLAACAWGRPSLAFGPPMAAFDGARRAPRLPGPPYHVVSRILDVEGGQGQMKVGSRVTAAYDVPPDAWYFADNQARVMPFAILLEVALQPCGWLSVYVGVPALQPDDLLFRNLDGHGRFFAEVPDGVGTLTTTARLTSLSVAGSTVLVSFTVTVRAGDVPVCELETGFGFFPPASMVDQAGLPVDAARRAAFEAPGPSFPVGERLRPGKLRMIEEITGWWPTGGAKGLGRIRAARDVDPSDWYFKAHFFQDPVQPGSLGLEAMLQALQVAAIALGLTEGLAAPRFEAVARGAPLRWKYRGQVVPEAKRVVVDLDVVSIVDGELRADGSLYVDGKRIYEALGFGLRVVDGAPPTVAPRRLDPRVLAPFWRTHCAIPERWPTEDILRGLARFVREVRVDPATEALRGKAALYVANHQVGCESAMAAIVLGGRLETVVTIPAKLAHRDTWVGRMLALFSAWPGSRPLDLARYIDRDDPASVLAFRDEALRLVASGGSILVHVDGTRSVSCREPVRGVSGVFVDLAVALGIPVVPMRFAGGLPVEPGARLEFPIGYAAQDYVVGAPIAATRLAALPYAERARRVVDAINALADPDEVPNPPDPAFAERVDDWARLRGGPGFEAVVLAALAELDEISPAGRALLRAAKAGRAPTGDTPEAEALRGLYRWLVD